MSGPDQALAVAFTHPGVAVAYQHRPPYPEEVFDILSGLITDRPRDVLDLGAGEGALARPLASRVDHVDALDMSAAMIENGRQRPGGEAPNLRWVLGAAETAELAGPYAMVTAGASLHWMARRPTLERVAAAMTASAPLAIVYHEYHDLPWRAEVGKLIARHSRSSRFDPTFRIADAITAAGLFTVAGYTETRPARFRQKVGDYVEQFHSTASLAREWMAADEAGAFDRAVEAIVAPYATDGVLDMAVVAEVTWGYIPR
jgi:trans-aconitate methyltransferase